MKCPKCGGELKQSDKALGCANWKDGCHFTIWKTVAGHTLTDKEKEDLVEKGKTELIDGFVSKKGSTFAAFLVLDDEKRVQFEFPPRDGEEIDNDLHCPICGKLIRKTDKVWSCSDRNCSFAMWNDIAGHTLTNEEKKELLEGKKIGPFDDFFSKKKGMAFSASLRITDGNVGFEFD